MATHIVDDAQQFNVYRFYLASRCLDFRLSTLDRANDRRAEEGSFRVGFAHSVGLKLLPQICMWPP